MRRLLALTAAAAGAVVLIVATPAGAQTNPYDGTTTGLTTTATTPAPGGSFTISGDGCVAGGTVALWVGDTSAGSVTADASGAFSAALTAPTTPGTYVVNAACGPVVLGVVITVAGAPAAPGAAPLPATGSDSISVVQYGIALLVVGGITVLAVRNRRTAGVSVDA